MPISPLESRKATRSSPSKRKRTGGQSGLGNSLGSIAGSQNRRNSSPMGVPGPTRHANSLSSLLNKAPPCIGHLNHSFSDPRFIVEAARVQPWSASEISQCVGMYLTEEDILGSLACVAVREKRQLVAGA